MTTAYYQAAEALLSTEASRNRLLRLADHMSARNIPIPTDLQARLIEAGFLI